MQIPINVKAFRRMKENCALHVFSLHRAKVFTLILRRQCPSAAALRSASHPADNSKRRPQDARCGPQAARLRVRAGIAAGARDRRHEETAG